MTEMDRGQPLTANRSNQLHVDRDGRKPLFVKQASSSDLPVSRPALSQGRRAKSDPQGVHAEADASEASILTPGGSRIPRLNGAAFRDRKPISLSEAFKLAQEEKEEAEKERQLGGSPSPAPRSWRATRKENEPLNAHSPNARRWQPQAKDGDHKTNGTGTSLQERIQEWRSKSRMDDAGVPELVPGIDDPLESPDKTFTWQVDQDFTAGDLQISDSPRIKVGSNRPFANRPSILDKVERRSPKRFASPARNTKLDDIRAREVTLGDSIGTERRYDRLEEIRAREAAAERQFPLPERNQPRPRNTKLDDIRQREEKGLSKRAIAAARLAEIKEMNAQTRSVPGEARPPMSSDLLRSSKGVQGEPVPDTPVTVYKNYRGKQDEPDFGEKHEPGPNERELLRRLAKATGLSPGDAEKPARSRSREKEDRAKGTKSSERKSSFGAHLRNSNEGTTSDRKTSNANSRESNDGASDRKSSFNTHTRNGEGTRPTVGFAGLRHKSSEESVRSKRSSMHSETDPTARIEAEMKLFAPADNYSERGSIRAPSPQPDSDDDVEATPKPDRRAFLDLPTPRVTGAYVETPVTIKVEKVKDEIDVTDVPPKQLEAPVTFPDKSESRAWRQRDQDSASEPGDTASREEVDKKRSKSLPRRRAALKNSAKPPSAKDDLLELQRQHNVEDWTVDHIEKKLDEHRSASEAELERLSAELDIKPVVSPPIKFEPPADKEYHKMGKKLDTALLGLRSTDTRLQKLEAQAKDKKSQRKPHRHPAGESCADCMASNPISVTYMHLPLPKLYSHAPEFRLTLLGLVVFALSIWYAAESTMCAKYCRPATCATTPCVYAYDDPSSFGTALPVKLDQWTTGGTGRKIVNWAIEEVQDRIADAADAAHGRSLADTPVEAVTYAKKRQHRRRLQKKGLLAASSPPREVYQELGADEPWP